MKTQRNLILRIVSFALMAWALIAPAGRTEVKPCCTITAVDAQAATATAKENGTSRTFVFKVPDAKLFAKVRVGTPVYANFSTKQVSLDGKSVCCQIIRANTSPAASRSVALLKLARETSGVIPSTASFCTWPVVGRKLQRGSQVNARQPWPRI
jgi:hypothetical protein